MNSGNKLFSYVEEKLKENNIPVGMFDVSFKLYYEIIINWPHVDIV